MNKESMLYIFLVVMYGLLLFILINDYEENKVIENETMEDEYIKSNQNLTYSYYNHTTGEVKHKDSGIPIYNKVFKD